MEEEYTLLAQGDGVIGKVFYGASEIESIYRGSQFLWGAPYRLPTHKPDPFKYSVQELARTDGAQNVIYTIPENGFYEVEVMAASGGTAYHGSAGGAGGKIKTLVYLYKGSTCLLWSSGVGNNGYPANDFSLGGRGAYGTGGAEYGGGGGSPSCTPGADKSKGGGGAGFICGTNHRVQDKTFSNDQWTRTLNSLQGWNVGSYKVDHAYTFLLCGGGGGGTGDEGSPRAGGGGGGAWGNGGTMKSSSGVAGPGGTWGKGGDTKQYSAGGAGGWAILDFTRNVCEAGSGGGGGTNTVGYCVLRKATRTSRSIKINNSQDATITLEYNGSTHYQDYVEIDGGTVIKWTVYKFGYKSQYGTITLNNDTVLDIELAEDVVDNFDLGLVTDSESEVIDCESVTESLTEIIECGGI